jgi:hypothetical protein
MKNKLQNLFLVFALVATGSFIGSLSLRTKITEIELRSAKDNNFLTAEIIDLSTNLVFVQEMLSKVLERQVEYNKDIKNQLEIDSDFDSKFDNMIGALTNRPSAVSASKGEFDNMFNNMLSILDLTHEIRQVQRLLVFVIEQNPSLKSELDLAQQASFIAASNAVYSLPVNPINIDPNYVPSDAVHQKFDELMQSKDK